MRVVDEHSRQESKRSETCPLGSDHADRTFYNLFRIFLQLGNGTNQGGAI